MIRDMELVDASRRAGERALWLARASGSSTRAEQMGAPREVVDLMLKAAVPAHATTDSAAIAELQTQAEGLVAAAAGPVGFFDSIRPDTVQGLFHSSYGAALVRPGAKPVGQGRAVPATRLAMGRKVLREQEGGCIVVVTSELLRFGTAIALIERMVRAALATGTDLEFVTQLVVGAGGVATSGADSVAVHFDLRRAIEAIDSGADARFHVGVAPVVAKRLSLQTDLNGARAHPAMTPNGGVLGGMPAHLVEGLGDDVIVTDAAQLLTASGDVRLSASSAAGLELDDAPSGASTDLASPPAPAETNLVSMFQTGSVALKALREFDWTSLRDGHTVKITGAASTWGLDTSGSPPA